jgi:putative transposase
MTDDVMKALRTEFPLTAICRALGVARSAVYARMRRGPSMAERRVRQLEVAVSAAFKARNGRYGAPRLARDLRTEGHRVSRRRVAASMRSLGLVARPKRRYISTTDSTHGRPAPPNLLGRNFRVPKPNTAWVADTTYLPTGRGFVFLVVVLDLYARRVVGWSLGEHLDSKLSSLALRRAMASRRPPRGLIVHTDRGGEFLSRRWRKVLREFGAVASASATGNCYDNAVAESFFATLEFEGPRTTNWRGAEDAERYLPEFIDRWYNTERMHSFNRYRSPVEAEARWHLAA